MRGPSRLVLTNCLIIDATSPSPREGNVVISDGWIQDVSTAVNSSALDDAQVVDLAGGFLLPGLWDVHTHIGRGIPDIEARGEPAPERAIRAGRNCMDALALGTTGLRVVGERDFIDVAWKKAFSSGQFLTVALYVRVLHHHHGWPLPRQRMRYRSRRP